ncbi:MAG: sulfotransferase [Planctomycetota bacterium]|nr:MAG: sulfotransferase [Planctomycetota bacterium]
MWCVATLTRGRDSTPPPPPRQRDHGREPAVRDRLSASLGNLGTPPGNALPRRFSYYPPGKESRVNGGGFALGYPRSPPLPLTTHGATVSPGKSTLAPKPDANVGGREFHDYPWWTPRFWHGMPLGVWLPLLAENGFRSSPSRWGLVATITAAAGFNSVMEPISEAVFRRQLRRPPRTPPPLFIIGHWRSGTTLLHEWLMLDDQFCCPSTIQCMVPGHFLLTEKVLSAAIGWMVPKHRPMDNVAAGLDRPQEDEFALANLGGPSPYRRMAFPRTSSQSPEALDVTRLSEAELNRWQATMRRFVTALAVRDPRRLVLKSPPHTARIGVLRKMFPGARFLHIVRDPFVVFPSTVRLWKSMNATQALQVDRGDGLEEYVFAAFEEMYAAFERDRELLEPGELHEVRYEELVADPMARLAEAYDRLELGDFSRLRPLLEVETRKEYRTNTYRHDPRIVAEISRRWQPFLDRYGYAPPPPA